MTASLRRGTTERFQRRSFSAASGLRFEENRWKKEDRFAMMMDARTYLPFVLIPHPSSFILLPASNLKGTKFPVLTPLSAVGSAGGYSAPEPRITAGIVFVRILRSNHRDQWSMYSISNSIHFSKGMEQRPLTCQIHVMPGRTLKRRRYQSSQKPL